METSETRSDRPGAPPLGTRRAVGLLALGVPSVMVAVVGIVWLASPAEVAAWQCEGIGFGCVLPARDMVFVFGVVVGLPVSVVLVVSGALVVWRVPDGWKRTTVVGMLATEGVAWAILASVVAGVSV